MPYLAYLAGPITGLGFKESESWRDWFISKLPSEIQGLSPLRGKTYLKDEKCIAASYPDIALSCDRGIMTRDYNDVKRADVLVVNLLGVSKVSIGTVMEIAWARAFQLPVIVIIEKEGNVHDHPMIRECCGFRVSTLEEAVNLTKVLLLAR